MSMLNQQLLNEADNCRGRLARIQLGKQMAGVVRGTSGLARHKAEQPAVM